MLLLFNRRKYSRKILTTAPSNLVAYWPLNAVSGTVIKDYSQPGYDGVATGFDLLFPGIGDGNSCPFLDGVNDVGNVYSAGLAGAFNGQECSIALWMKVSAVGVWTDATQRAMLRLRVDASNNIQIAKVTANGTLNWQYTAGGTTLTRSKGSVSDIGWVHLGMTISKSADQVKAYYNGVQESATLTGLGTWAGSLAPTFANIGALTTTPTNVWSGYLAHVALWSTPLTAAQMAYLAKVR